MKGADHLSNQNTDTAALSGAPQQILQEMPPPTCDTVNNVYELKTKPELVRYYQRCYVSCFCKLGFTYERILRQSWYYVYSSSGVLHIMFEFVYLCKLPPSELHLVVKKIIRFLLLVRYEILSWLPCTGAGGCCCESIILTHPAGYSLNSFGVNTTYVRHFRKPIGLAETRTPRAPSR